MKVKDLKVQYIINSDGEKTAVVLSLETFQALIENINKLATLVERHNEPTVSYVAMVAELAEQTLLELGNNKSLEKACQKLEREQAWWSALPLHEREAYEGEFVAIHNQELVDHDKDKAALHHRIRARYGDTAILIMPAEGPRTIRIYSPKLVGT